MPSALYERGREAFAKGQINWLSKICLLSSNYSDIASYVLASTDLRAAEAAA